MARGPGGSSIGRGPGGPAKSRGGPGSGKGMAPDHGGSGGRKPGTKVCPTCHGSGRVPSGKTGSAKGKPYTLPEKLPKKRPGAKSMKKTTTRK